MASELGSDNRTYVGYRKDLRTAIYFKFHSIKAKLHLTTIGVVPVVSHQPELHRFSTSTINTTRSKCPPYGYSKISLANPYATRQLLYRVNSVYQQAPNRHNSSSSFVISADFSALSSSSCLSFKPSSFTILGSSISAISTSPAVTSVESAAC